LGVVGEGLLGAPADGVESARKRKRECRRDTDDAGDVGELSSDVLLGGSARLRSLAGDAAALELEGEEVVRVESGIDALQSDEAAEHQAGSDQQHKCQRYLRDRDDVAQESSAGEARVAAGGPKFIDEVGASSGVDWRHAEENCRSQRDE